MSLLPSLTKEAAVTVTAGAITPVTVAAEVVAYGADRGERAAHRARDLLHQLSSTATALQTVVLVVAEALEDGFLDELRAGLQHLATAVELMSVVNAQLEQAMPVVDATAPTLKVMNTTLTQLNATIAQLDALPGVRIARRFVARPGTAELV